MNAAVGAAADPWASAPSWWPDWRGHTAVLIASGPTAKDAPLYLCRGRDRTKVVAINSSIKLAPWADVLYACDFKWWDVHRGVPEFKGLKVSQDGGRFAKGGQFGKKYQDVRQVLCDHGTDELLMDRIGKIGWGGNSGFNAINLVAQFRAAAIILVGYDLRLDKGLHWHGKHGHGLNNPIDKNVFRWCKAIDDAAPALKRLGIPVFNTSPISNLKNYPKVSLQEALACTASPPPSGESTPTCGVSTNTPETLLERSL